MKKWSPYFFLFLFFSNLFAQEEMIKNLIRPFKTDNCTGWFDKSFKYDWGPCCVIHDLYFWAGGTLDHRKIADLRLKSCVKEKANNFHADLIYLGVVLGSLSPFKIQTKKWGNAWPDPHQYSPTTNADLLILKKSLQSTFESNPNLKDILTQSEIASFLATVEELNQKESEELSFKRSSR